MKYPLILIALLLAAGPSPSADLQIDYEKYELANGLDVILHEDHSDPIVAVATIVHVGSNREKPGRTGFAHFFEHMSFNDSENVPLGANRKLIPEWGGQRNGFTWSDGTCYYEVVPKDAFEKILWIDSDRLGFMINTVTQAALEREKQVVKNEKRERVDNAPYGHTSTIISANLYPPDHPYHWTVIGSLPDLQAATLEDVKEFYANYYGANNATLAIAGDIDIPRTRRLVQQWFGEIRRGPDVAPLKSTPVTLAQTRSLYHEDNFAKLPELRLVFPTAAEFSADTYALEVLAEVLAGSKQAPLYKVLVEERKLAPQAVAYHSAMELTGQFVLRVRANAGVDLDDVQAAIEEGLARFDRDGFSDNELQRVQAQMETELYDYIATALYKAYQLAYYNEYASDPSYLAAEAKRMRAVTREDVMEVFRRYIKGRPHILTSFVPQGQTELIADGAQKAEIYEEPFVADGAEEEVSQGEEAVYEKTPTERDRSEPPLDELPLLTTPAIWTAELENGVALYGIEHDEVPLVAFDLTLRGGHQLDPLNEAGTASLLASLMMQGTRQRTPVELEEAIGLLGADVNISAGDEEIRISANTLARNFEATLALVEEILLEPRWDAEEYQRLKRELDTRLKDGEANPRTISSVAYRRLLYGETHILGTPRMGTPETAARIDLDALKVYYERNFSPSVATLHVAGAVGRDRVLQALENIGARWQAAPVHFPDYALPAEGKGGQVFFIDVPDAKQSVIRIGRLALSAGDDDFNNAIYANLRLGGGTSGRFFQVLRLEKGYTYGAYSTLRESLEIGPFTAYASVRSNVTLESLQLMRGLLQDYQATFTEREVEVTKNQVVKGHTRNFESLGAKLGTLRKIGKLGLPLDFLEREQEELLAMGLEDFHTLIDRYFDEDEMFYLIVGDAETQLERVAELGYGEAAMLDIYGGAID